MPTIVWKNALLSINGVDYSGDVHDVTLNYSAEMLDASVMGVNSRIYKGGLKKWDISFKGLQNYSSGHIGATLFALVGTTTCVEIRPDNSCSTAINPSYSGIAIIDGNGFGGAVGTLLQSPIKLVCAGDLSRASSS